MYAFPLTGNPVQEGRVRNLVSLQVDESGENVDITPDIIEGDGVEEAELLPGLEESILHQSSLGDINDRGNAPGCPRDEGDAGSDPPDLT